MDILCFGDSNTYGFDPRSYLGGRYPASVRWTGLLAAKTGWLVREAGQNGREIPAHPAELAGLARQVQPGQTVVLMLGTNDLLQHPWWTAEEVAARMACCLDVLRPACPVLLVAPPPMCPGAWVQEPALLQESARLSACYASLAAKCGADFADAGTWDVPLLFDGVHFSPEGHRAFAAGILPVLRRMEAGQ